MCLRRLPGLLLFVIASQAHAVDDLDVCVNASEDAQKQLDQGLYLDARRNLLRCSRDVCPDVVAEDCMRLLDEVERATPTLVFGVHGLDPEASAGVRITIDGVPTEYAVDGKPIQVDPGWHTVVFTTRDGRAQRVKTLVKAGEHNRVVEASFRGSSVAAPEPAAPSEPAAARWPGYALVAGGILGLGGATYFWVGGRRDLDALRDGCGKTSSCAQSDVDDARRTILVGDVLGGLGAVAMGTGAYLLLRGSSGSEQASKPAMALGASASPDAGSVLVSGTF
ncbi:MAG: hypothetical protein ACOC1F_10500 [Myxococcota bacterium]